MGTFILTFAIIALAMVGLAVGAILGKHPLKGSCGNVYSIKGADCAGCTRRAPR